ncbi:TonB-dependent receptor [Anopheles sinensis]|uniref:TonB-dependent receptor n=1 Tax=Anopheles sinensis TaxID=74873 RepID=A0A084WL72_ANOSI|nr:TonB-dependent receptor [Anopheles sinensis]
MSNVDRKHDAPSSTKKTKCLICLANTFRVPLCPKAQDRRRSETGKIRPPEGTNHRTPHDQPGNLVGDFVMQRSSSSVWRIYLRQK